jgi:transcriptional regulator GlxA family with amidase domain
MEVSYLPTVQMFGIRFKPAGITAFTHVPVEEFTNQSMALELIETLFDSSFEDILSEKQTIEKIIEYTDNYLIESLSKSYNVEKQVLYAVDLIDCAKGQLSLAKVAANVCLSPRHFERKFKSAIGISPKTFAKIIRFKYALKCLKTNPLQDLLSIAVACGYYDHTHLIKDFKTLSGNTPTTLR